MTDPQQKTPDEKTREWFTAQLRDGYTPNQNISAELRQANALEFIAYALGELVNRIDRLDKNLVVATEMRR